MLMDGKLREETYGERDESKASASLLFAERKKNKLKERKKFN